MAEKAKHAFGALENVDSAISSGKIDAYDILFVKDAEGKPYVGWIDKDGQKVIVDHTPDLTGLEEELEAQIATKANAEEVEALGQQIATKVDETKLNEVAQTTVANANAYTDEKIEAAVAEHIFKKYEVTDVPVGTLVDYGEKEIRVMAPANTKWSLQKVGEGGDANSYYMTFKTYAPSDDAVGYIEHLGGKVDSEILTNISIDKNGRRYQPTWLALAKYDEAADTWTYYGVNSSANKYIGWDYQIDWYNADGVMIASDCVRINLSNEKCHSSIEPYYVSEVKTYVNTQIEEKIEEKIAEVGIAYEVVEF